MNFRGCSDVFVDVLMSSRGGPRTGSGRKKIHVSFAEGVKFWQRPSKDLVGLPDLFFLGFCEDLLRILKRFRVCWPSSFPRTTKKVSTNFFTSTGHFACAGSLVIFVF